MIISRLEIKELILILQLLVSIPLFYMATVHILQYLPQTQYYSKQEEDKEAEQRSRNAPGETSIPHLRFPPMGFVILILQSDV